MELQRIGPKPGRVVYSGSGAHSGILSRADAAED
jgi:hypothetical protein